MGFKDARSEAIKALQEGRVQHEARGEIDEKNFLVTGEVTTDQVVRLLRACRGTQHTSSKHHQASEVEVHIFRPETSLLVGGPKRRWYIKLYFIEPDVWFISVHH